MEEAVEIGVQAAPRGHRQGIVTSSCDGWQFVLTVEPKPWRTLTSTGPVWIEWPRDRSRPSLDLRLCEADRLVVLCGHPNQERAIRAALTEAATQAEEDARQASDGEDLDVDDESAGDANGPRDARHSLLLAELPRSEWGQRAHDDTPRAITSQRDLFDALSLRLSVPNRRLTAQRDTSPATGALRHPLFRPVLYRDFALEMLELSGQVRRNYVEHTQALHTIRGRIETEKLPRAAARSWIPLTCTFEDFTHVTPLLRILVSALEMVIQRRALAPELAGLAVTQQAHEAAIRARRVLEDVPSIPARAALRMSHTVRLSRLETAWTNALALARIILEASDAPVGGSGRTAASATQLSWDSSVQWEQLCSLVLQHLVPHGRVGHGSSARMPPPWGGFGLERTVDLIVDLDDARVFADAKYKTIRADGTPSTGDSYQLYYYADGHRTEEPSPQPPHSCLLLYPRTVTRGRTDPVLHSPAVNGAIVRPSGREGGGPWLWLIHMPFPTVEESSEAGLNRWADRCATAIQEAIARTRSNDPAVPAPIPPTV